MGCEGYGYYDCLCGGDLCICSFNGEEPCPGCDDCEGSDQIATDDDWSDADPDACSGCGSPPSFCLRTWWCR